MGALLGIPGIISAYITGFAGSVMVIGAKSGISVTSSNSDRVSFVDFALLPMKKHGFIALINKADGVLPW